MHHMIKGKQKQFVKLELLTFIGLEHFIEDCHESISRLAGQRVHAKTPNEHARLTHGIEMNKSLLDQALQELADR